MRSDTDVVIVITDADGNTKILGADAPIPGDRPQSVQWATQQGSGFYTASFTLSCPVDADRDDIHLLDDVTIRWADGDTAYEGFVAAMPRSMDADGQGTLTITCAGWIASAADNPFTMVFVDRDLSSWRAPSRARLVNLIAQTYRNTDASTRPDVTSGEATLLAEIGEANWITGVLPCSEAWYDAGSENALGSIYYDWERANDTNHISPWYWDVAACTVDDGSVAVSTTGNLKAATSTPGYFDAGAKRFGRLFFGHTASPNTGSEGLKFGLYWKRIAVYGDHDLPLIGDDPKGVAAADVIRWVIDQRCPLLNAGGVQDTTYPIAHLVFDSDTTPYDALLKVNSYHQWLISVWEDRTVHFAPYDLADWDWEIRHDEIGNTIGLQGDEYTDLRNHIRVHFTNVETGAAEVLTGDDYDDLRDDSIDNPLNQHGRDRSGEPFTIPYPTTRDNALELGRLRLIEDNRPKAPGSFTVAHYLRDRAGILQPAGKARAGDRIRLTSSVNLSDRPRLIHETSYADDGKTVTIAVDGTSRVLDAYMDRTTTTLAASGLS